MIAGLCSILRFFGPIFWSHLPYERMSCCLDESVAFGLFDYWVPAVVYRRIVADSASCDDAVFACSIGIRWPQEAGHPLPVCEVYILWGDWVFLEDN